MGTAGIALVVCDLARLYHCCHFVGLSCFFAVSTNQSQLATLASHRRRPLVRVSLHSNLEPRSLDWKAHCNNKVSHESLSLLCGVHRWLASDRWP